MLPLYFYNPNARQGKNNKFRDYCVEIRRTKDDRFEKFLPLKGKPVSELTAEKMTGLIADHLPERVLARCRVRNFGDSGVYKIFMVRSPGVYYIRICRNHSFNTILNGIFVNNLRVIRVKNGEYIVGKTGFYRYPSSYTEELANTPSPFLSFADVDTFFAKKHAIPYRRLLVESLRHMLKNNNDVRMLKNALYVKNEKENEIFDQFLADYWADQQNINIPKRSSVWAKHSPHTVPLSIDELKVMQKLGIDWKEYREGSTPKIPLQDLKRQLQSYLDELNKQTK